MNEKNIVISITGASMVVDETAPNLELDEFKGYDSLLKRRPKFEETHTKRAYWIRNDLLEILNAVAVQHGDKNMLINRGLELAVKELIDNRGDK